MHINLRKWPDVWHIDLQSIPGRPWLSWRHRRNHFEILTLCPNWHELPKSTILMADRLGLQRRIFSGFKSQWMMLSSGVDRNSRAVHSCWANFRVRLRETPLKFVLRSRSYKLYDNSSNTRHKWFLHIKCLFNLTETKKRQKISNWNGGFLGVSSLHLFR